MNGPRASRSESTPAYTAREIASIVSAGRMMGRKLDEDQIHTTLIALEALGMEVAPFGWKSVVQKLTAECPGCGGSMVLDEGSCDCVFGRVSVLGGLDRDDLRELVSFMSLYWDWSLTPRADVQSVQPFKRVGVTAGELMAVLRRELGDEKPAQVDRVAELEQALRDVRFHTGGGDSEDGTINEIRATVDRVLP